MAQAITYDRFGDPDVLTVTEVKAPEPGPDQILVAVKAIGVNLIDAKIRSGSLAGFKGFPSTFPIIPGFDIAGVVTAAGTDVNRFEKGTEVLGSAVAGAYSEYALMDPAWTWEKPPSLSWPKAAALPTIAESAVRALKHLALKAGEVLMIHGAAGGVGSVATQLAIRQGVEVISVVRRSDLNYAHSIGAAAIEYGPGLVQRVRAIFPMGVDAVLDTSGADVIPDSVELAGGGGRVVSLTDVRASDFGAIFTGIDPADRAPEGVPLVANLVAIGEVAVRIAATYPLALASAAHWALNTHQDGRLVLIP